MPEARAVTVAAPPAATEEPVAAQAAAMASFDRDKVVYSHEHGLLTGYEWGGTWRGVFLEHMIAYPGAPVGALVVMLSQAQKQMRDLGYDRLGVYVPDDQPALQQLAQRFKFKCYLARDNGAYYVKEL